MAVSPLIRIVLMHNGYAEYSYCAPAVADSLAAGCLLAFYQDRLRETVKRYFVSPIAFLALCFVTVGTACVLYRAHLVLLWGVIPSLIAVATCAAIEREDPFLNSRPLVWTGMLSYSLYLWQQPFLVFDGPLNYLSVRLILTFAFAYISYRFVEQPMLRFRAPSTLASQVTNSAIDFAKASRT